MCGRSRTTLNRQQVAAAARVAPERWRNEESFVPNYNLAPGHDAPVVRRGEDGSNEVQTMRWGLVPSWTKKDAKPDHFRMFNARSETVAEKSVFSRLLTRQRCIFLAEGFYEWKKDGGKKQPYYIHRGEGNVLQMAGLYDTWHTGEGDDRRTLRTFTVLTTDSCKRLRWLHDRMPVLLTTREAQDAWLAEEIHLKGLNQLAVPYNGEDLVWHQVTQEMGKPAFQGPDCCKPLKKGPGIPAFFKKPSAAGKPAAAAAVGKQADEKQPAAAAAAGKDSAAAGKDAGAAEAAGAAPGATTAEQAAAGMEQEGGAAVEPGGAQQHSGGSAPPSPAMKAEQSSSPPEGSAADGAAAAGVGKTEPQAAAADPTRQSDGAAAAGGDPAAAAGATLAAGQHADGTAPGPALPLNPDDDPGEIKQEEQEQQQQNSQSASEPKSTPPDDSNSKPGKKRPAGGDASAARSPGGGKRAKKDATPAKGQKTMNAFFAVK